jgi:hypothetical protein
VRVIYERGPGEVGIIVEGQSRDPAARTQTRRSSVVTPGFRTGPFPACRGQRCGALAAPDIVAAVFWRAVCCSRRLAARPRSAVVLSDSARLAQHAPARARSRRIVFRSMSSRALSPIGPAATVRPWVANAAIGSAVAGVTRGRRTRVARHQLAGPQGAPDHREASER